MEIPELIYRLIKDRIINQCYPCEVLSVDKEADTCDVRPFDDGPELLRVRLTASVEEKTTKVVQYPKVGSVVLVGIIDSIKTQAYVCAFSELEEIRIDCGKITINGGELGGLVKAKLLAQELNKTNQVLQAIMNVLSTWVPVPSDGGAALKTAMATALTGKTLGNYDKIENEKITH